MLSELRARFEIVSAELPDLKQQATVDHARTLQEAIRTADRLQSTSPLTRFFVFEWMTGQTRLLMHHTLNR